MHLEIELPKDFIEWYAHEAENPKDRRFGMRVTSMGPGGREYYDVEEVEGDALEEFSELSCREQVDWLHRYFNSLSGIVHRHCSKKEAPNG